MLKERGDDAERLNDELFPRLTQDERALVAALGAPKVHDAFQVLLQRYIQSGDKDMAERILVWFPKKGEFTLSISHWVLRPPSPKALKTIPYILDYDMKLDDNSLRSLLTWLYRSKDRTQFEQFFSRYGARLTADEQAEIVQ